MLGDLRYALRIFAKSPGFALVAVLSLALGIGGNTAIFTLSKAVFLKPLPVTDVARLVTITTTDVKNPNAGGISFPNFKDYRDQNSVFSGMFVNGNVPLSLTGGSGEPEQVGGEMVSASYFSVLGVQPQVGRAFFAEEDQVPDRNPVVVLSDRVWKERFGADRGLIGKTITLNAHAFTVIGVAPEGFQGTSFFGSTALWVPIMMHHTVDPRDSLFEERRSLLLNSTARLKSGVEISAASSQMQALAHQLAETYPAPNQGRSVRLTPLADSVLPAGLRSQMSRVGTILGTIVGVVLLIACANVANLLLVRAAARRKEVAIRTSLGAVRWRMIRQLLTETLVLALISGMLGLLVGVWAKDLIWSFRPPFMQQTNLDLRLDPGIIAFTMGVSLLTGLLFGLAPAMQMSRPDLATELKERTNQNARGGRFGLREVLVVVQVALSLISLAGAGMFLRSLRNAEAIDSGLDAHHLMVLNVSPGRQGYTRTGAQDFYHQVQQRVAGLPGVRTAAFAEGPFGGGLLRSVIIEGGEVIPGSNGILTRQQMVSPGYLETAGIRLLRGRDFRDSDRDGAVLVAIVNEAMSARFWPGQDPIGKRFKFFGQDYREVIGIAKNSKYGDLSDAPVVPFAYIALAQNYSPSMMLHVNAVGDPSKLLGVVRQEVQAIDRNLPVVGVQTLDDIIARGLWAPRLGAGLLTVFGLLALTLATIGLYGVMAYSVSQRTGEIGIRMALGARPMDMTRMLFRQVLVLVGPGLVIGTLLAAGLARWVTTMLYGVSPYDPITFLASAATLAAVAALATILPARRAMRIDPLIALRQE